jgi:anti-anti-sigma factor
MRLADMQLSLHEGLLLVRLSGEIDSSNSAELRTAITEATPNDAHGVVLDLTSVDYLDSAGIHLLFRLRESLRARSQGLRVVVPPASMVTDALRLAGVKEVVELDDTVEQAIAQLRASVKPG